MLSSLNLFSQDSIFYHLAIYKKNMLERKMEKEFRIKLYDPLKKMKKLLKFMEKINTIFKPFSPCKKGCSKCCYIDVAISRLEVSLIERYLLPKKYNTIIKNTDNINTIFVKETEKGEVFGKMSNGEKCPFLKNDRCFIYKIRPYFCRRYFLVFEKDNRKCGYNDNFATTLYNPVTDKEYFKLVTYNIDKNNIITPNQELFEIRDCFHEA